MSCVKWRCHVDQYIRDNSARTAERTQSRLSQNLPMNRQKVLTCDLDVGTICDVNMTRNVLRRKPPSAITCHHGCVHSSSQMPVCAHAYVREDVKYRRRRQHSHLAHRSVPPDTHTPRYRTAVGVAVGSVVVSSWCRAVVSWCRLVVEKSGKCALELWRAWSPHQRPRT